MNNKPMLNAYPDSLGGKLSDIAALLKKKEMQDTFSSFYIRVVELEQEKLDLQGKNARIVVGKDGKVYEQ